MKIVNIFRIISTLIMTIYSCQNTEKKFMFNRKFCCCSKKIKNENNEQKEERKLLKTKIEENNDNINDKKITNNTKQKISIIVKNSENSEIFDAIDNYKKYLEESSRSKTEISNKKMIGFLDILDNEARINEELLQYRKKLFFISILEIPIIYNLYKYKYITYQMDEGIDQIKQIKIFTSNVLSKIISFYKEMEWIYYDEILKEKIINDEKLLDSIYRLKIMNLNEYEYFDANSKEKIDRFGKNNISMLFKYKDIDNKAKFEFIKKNNQILINKFDWAMKEKKIFTKEFIFIILKIKGLKVNFSNIEDTKNKLFISEYIRGDCYI